MKWIDRSLENRILEKWGSQKAILVLGPRQVGKTSLLHRICKANGDYLFLNADESEVRIQLTDPSEERLRTIVGRYKTIFIDEAQRIPGIGLTLKIITDRLQDVQLIVSGSSSLDLSNSLNEPLTGRKWEFRMFPMSWQEISSDVGYLSARKQLEQRIIYGMYPDVINHPGQEVDVLRQLSGSYLYQDILQYGQIRKPELLERLLTALALQIGSEVSYQELAQLLRIDRATVEQYIQLLEKAFIIFRLQPLSRNLRNEVSTNRKIYFYDTGLRNAVLADFKPLGLRNDVGGLWENFLIAERLKLLQNQSSWAKMWFWRTYQQQEIDYIEEYNGAFTAWQMKWNPKAKSKYPEAFSTAYAASVQPVIHPENFEAFVLPPE